MSQRYFDRRLIQFFFYFYFQFVTFLPTVDCHRRRRINARTQQHQHQTKPVQKHQIVHYPVVIPQKNHQHPQQIVPHYQLPGVLFHQFWAVIYRMAPVGMY